MPHKATWPGQVNGTCLSATSAVRIVPEIWWTGYLGPLLTRQPQQVPISALAWLLRHGEVKLHPENGRSPPGPLPILALAQGC